MKMGGFHGRCNWVQIFGLDSLSLRRNYGDLGGILRESGGVELLFLKVAGFFKVLDEDMARNL